jgi:phage shock protein PspC (stress-responsive transcriptional regulator)
MFLVHNERTKLTAAWLNTLATALVAAGVFAPGVAVLYGLSSLNVGRALVVAVLLGCMTLGVAIHLAAWMLHGRMRE